MLKMVYDKMMYFFSVFDIIYSHLHSNGKITPERIYLKNFLAGESLQVSFKIRRILYYFLQKKKNLRSKII